MLFFLLQGSNVVEDQDLLEIGILNSAHRQRLLQAIRLLPRVSKAVINTERLWVNKAIKVLGRLILMSVICKLTVQVSYGQQIVWFTWHTSWSCDYCQPILLSLKFARSSAPSVFPCGIMLFLWMGGFSSTCSAKYLNWAGQSKIDSEKHTPSYRAQHPNYIDRMDLLTLTCMLLWISDTYTTNILTHRTLLQHRNKKTVALKMWRWISNKKFEQGQIFCGE